MSFRKSTRYTLKCDMCGQPYRQEGAARPAVDTKQSLFNRATADDWQTSDDYTSDDYQYCPQHWHATCVECGRHTIASRNRLKRAGWRVSGGAPAGDRLLCPEHAANHARPPVSPRA
jgi:rRNA maturation protein Nop10